MRVRFSLFVALLLASPAGWTVEVYRCLGDQGEVQFSGRPCGADAVVVLEQQPSSPGSSRGLRASEKRWLKERARQRAKRSNRKKPQAQAASRRAAAEKQAYRCRRKRHQLDAVRAKLRRGYKPAQGESLRRRRQVLQDYLSAFCT